MGELTRKAASSPIPNPLSDFPSVWCAAVPPSSSPVHWVLSIFHAILSTPVSLAKRHHQTSFPGCGSWICEIGKLSVSLLLFSPPFYTFPPLFSSRVQALPPRSRVDLHERTKGSSEYSEEYATMYYFFQFQFSILDVERGKKSRYLFQFRQSIQFESITDRGYFRVEEGWDVGERVISISIREKVKRLCVRIPISSDNSACVDNWKATRVKKLYEVNGIEGRSFQILIGIH